MPGKTLQRSWVTEFACCTRAWPTHLRSCTLRLRWPPRCPHAAGLCSQFRCSTAHTTRPLGGRPPLPLPAEVAGRSLAWLVTRGGRAPLAPQPATRPAPHGPLDAHVTCLTGLTARRMAARQLWCARSSSSRRASDQHGTGPGCQDGLPARCAGQRRATSQRQRTCSGRVHGAVTQSCKCADDCPRTGPCPAGLGHVCCVAWPTNCHANAPALPVPSSCGPAGCCICPLLEQHPHPRGTAGQAGSGCSRASWPYVAPWCGRQLARSPKGVPPSALSRPRSPGSRVISAYPRR
jgi:hypothetical protein